MKKWIGLLLCAVCLFSVTACKKEESSGPRLWCVQPSSLAAQDEIKKAVRDFDADANVSFVPADEINNRLAAAMEKKEAPDVFMFYAEALPDWAEKKQLADVSDRLRVSKVKADELSDAARRACLYQGKTWGVPMFSDVYMLATNRALAAVPPETVAGLKTVVSSLGEKGVASFENLPPERQALLFEAALRERGGSVLNARRTRLAFASQEGEEALADCKEILAAASKEDDALGMEKAAFSVLTIAERRALAQKYPDAEISLSPLFGLDRLQTVALGMDPEGKQQTRAFRLLEFLQGKSEEFAALCGLYPAQKSVTPLTETDADATVRLALAKPAPDLCGYAALESMHLPAALAKAEKGVPAADALTEAAAAAAPEIWPGKRE